MNAEALLQSIFQTRTVQSGGGVNYPLDSNVDENEGRFLQSLIRTYRPASTIEVGCAYGISSLFICAELEKIQGGHHTIIDGFQQSVFHNIGVSNLNRAGIGFYQLIEELSETALPRLLADGKRFDFCFIDGNHTFDHTLLDFFYLNRMLNVGGIMVFDDAGFPAVNKAVRYMMNYPAYVYEAHVPVHISPNRIRFEQWVKQPVHWLARCFPRKIREEIFSATVIHPDKSVHLHTSMIAFRKIKEDEREWFWYEPF